MTERIPPHNTDAERSVLGAALLSKDALADVIEIVKEDDFYDTSNKEIFRAIKDMYLSGKPVDILTVSEELKRRKTLEACGGRSYIGELTSDVPTITNAAEYARLVSEKSSMRALINISEGIRDKCFDSKEEPKEILNEAEKKILEIAQKNQKTDFVPIKDVLLRDMKLLDEAVKNQGQVTGLTTGFKKLDEMTSGLHKSDLVILAARPAMGKTAFALNVAQNAAVKGKGAVLIFSLEMSAEQLGQRLLAMEARVNMEDIKKGKIERSDWERIYLASDTLAATNIVIDDTADLSVFEIKNKCRRMKAEKGLDLVVIDYLQLMHGDGRSDNRQQEVSNLSRNLKLLAREMDCPVIVLSQLSRGPEQRPNHRPQLSDLRESGSIEQDADIVMFLYRDDYYNEESEKPGICEVNLAKHRNGPTGTVELTWVARYTKFSDKA